MNNEEKILEMLTSLTEKVDRLEGTQARQGEQLTRQGEQLARQGEQLAQMNERLTRQGEQMAQQREHLTRQGEQLAQMNERLEELDDRSLRSAVMLENQVLPQLQLLYEGQVNLQQTLAPKERVEVLEDEVVTIKSMLKSMSHRLAALEKAR